MNLCPEVASNVAYAVEGQYGWAVASQARSLFSGAPFEDMNDNALRLICTTLEDFELFDEAEEIEDYLKRRESE